MKFLFLLLTTLSLLLSCDGDCMQCHPKLLKNGVLDKDHALMETCKECHKISGDDLEKMGALCGQDCWECHSVEKTKLVPNEAHYALDGCIACHTKLKTNNATNWLNQN